MIKKIVSLILTFAVCFSVASCTVRRSGKPYIDDSWFDYENHPTKRYQCLVLFIRHEFNEMFPQA